ncbi:MAG TPA: hypothetical protein VNK95_23050, partial [Caldilineaceae bacterium]|nr:hypothetical protein [Caldilineaceae bacterium]
SRRDFLTILRLIRSGAGGEPKLLTGPLDQEAFIPFNRQVNAILEAQIPPGGSADIDAGEEILRAEHHARVPELLETFRDALKAVARESPLFLVLDHLDLPGNEFNDYLRPLLLDLCQSDINLCIVAVPTHAEGFDWQPLRDFMLEVRIDSFPEQEWVDLALDYVQRILDPTRFADDLQRRQWLADLRDKLQGLSGVIIQGPWKPVRLLGLDLLLHQ